MNFLKIAGDDIKKILKNKFIALAIIAIIAVPIIYSIFYLAAFWDPYGNTNKMPVAVVNMDKGSVNEGEKVNYGQDVVDKLKNNKKAKWCFVSYDKAEQGIKGKDYYAEFVIPKDFSDKILKVKHGKPEKGVIIYKANGKKNYLAAMITDKALEKIEAEVSSSIADEFTKLTFDKMYDVKDGMRKAADGSKELHDGIGTLSGKVPEMEDGVKKLKDGSELLTSKLGEAQAGSNLLKDGVVQAKTKLDGEITKLDNNKAIQGLLSGINEDKINMMRGILADAIQFKDKDLSMLDNIPKLLTKQNVGILKKTSKDLKEANIEAILQDPTLKSLGALNTKENMQNAQALMNDVDKLQKIDMNKINSMLGALGESDKLLGLANSAGNLYGDISKNADKLIPLQALASDPNLEQYLGSAVSLQTKFNQFKSLTGYKDGKIDPSALAKMDPSMIGGFIASIDKDAKNLEKASTQIQKIGPDKVKESITYVNSMGPKVKVLKDTVDANKKSIENIQGALSPDNVKYVKALVPQLVNMKSDLDKNAGNLKAMQVLLAKTQDPSTKQTLNKIQVLQKDINDAGPIIVALQKQVTEENLNEVQSAPALIAKVKDMQNKVKENEKVISLAQESLNMGNVEMAKNLLAAVPKLKSGMNKLSDGATTLSDGLGKLKEGSATLDSGIGTLKGKMPELKDGVKKLDDGSKELQDKLGDGAKELDDNLVNSSETMGKFVSKPVESKDESISTVPNYGSGFAPYFIALSLWVGAMMMFFVIESRVNKRFEDASSLSQVLGKFIVFGGIGVIQAICVCTAILKLGLKPENTALFFGFNIFVSLVFVVIMQSLISLLGDVGRFIAMVLLILQLTSSAGTYPMEILPKLFRVLNPYMPFTYVIQGLREIISGPDLSIVLRDAGVLGLIAVVFFAVLVGFKKKGDKVQEFIEDVREEIAA